MVAGSFGREARSKGAPLEGGPVEGGRGREARTPDLRIWNPLLYQLSYTPSVRLVMSERNIYFVSRCIVCFLHNLQNFFIST